MVLRLLTSRYLFLNRMVLGVTCMGKDCIRHVMEKGSLPYENIQDLKYAAKQHVKELAVAEFKRKMDTKFWTSS